MPLVRRPRATALHRLARLIPGVASRIDRAEATEYEEATRKAFRAGTSLQSPKLFAPPRVVESPGLKLGAARPGAFISAPPAPPAPPATPAIEPARQPADVEPPARGHGGQAGETAPDFLLRTPKSVIPIADDFFDGLIRRIEGDR